jgi:hypothetical protein
MGLLYDMNLNAYFDSRQDNRNFSTSNANSYTFAPIYAFDSSVMGNSAKSNASAESELRASNEQGFTGKNAQTVLIALGIAVIGVGAVYAATKL